MLRRQFLFSLLLAPLALVSVKTLRADQPILDADIMKKILRPPTPDGNAFIDKLVNKVKKGKVPADLVDSTVQWARKKNSKNRFQYFKQALILRAAQQGVSLN
jgi:hypothetical protein